MKKIIMGIFFCTSVSQVSSQAVGIGTATPNASAQLEISSTTKGTLITRMTTAQRKAIVNPASGLLVYDLDKKTVYMYDNGKWQPLMFASNDNKLPALSLQPADLDVSASFGMTASISGDYAIVGAPHDEASIFGQGSVYIFFRSNGVWTQQAKLFASDPQINANFGFSVSIDGNSAIVGAPNYDGAGGGTNEGRAYVFTRTGTVWSQVGFLLANDRMPHDNFGRHVSISGIYAVVGAPYDDGSGTDQGSAYVYNAPWIFGQGQLAKLTASDGAADDIYSWSLDIDGDYIIIGSPNDDGTVSNQGSAYVYYRLTNPAGWTNGQPHQAKFSKSTPGVGDNYGSSVAINSTLLAIGVPGHDGIFSGQGAVYIFRRSGGMWSSLATVTAPDAEASMEFGSSVSLDNNYLLIGSIWDDNDIFPDQGSAYLYHYNGASFILQRKIYDDDPETGELFGYVVGLSGFNIIIAAPSKNDSRGLVAFLNLE
jgi:FG-GAP repeat